MPDDLATRLAEQLRAHGGYDVVAPDLRTDAFSADTPFAAVLTARPLAGHAGIVVIQIPPTFEEPLLVTVDDVTVAVKVDIEHPFEDVVGVVGQFLEPTPVVTPLV